MNIPISAKQAQFLQSSKKVVYFRAGIQSGKTRILCHKAKDCAIQGESFLLVSYSYPFLRDVILKTFKIIIEDCYKDKIPVKINESSMTIWINGTEILLRSGDDPDSLRGIFVHKVGIDEARNFKNRYIYDVLIGRCSQGSHPQCFITSTSKGKNWVTELRDELGDEFEMVTQSSLDNPFTSDQYKQSLLSSYTSRFAQQEIYGDEVEIGAGAIDPVWFKVIDYIKPVEGVRYYDVAVSTKTAADYSAGALCTFNDSKFIIHDMFHAKITYPELKRKIVENARSDGEGVTIAIEEAGQQRGFIDDLLTVRELENYSITASKPKEEKFLRAMPWASRAELGMVYVCRGAWNRTFFEECGAFTQNDSHEHDDQIDAVSGAYKVLSFGNDFGISTGNQVYQELIHEQETAEEAVPAF